MMKFVFQIILFIFPWKIRRILLCRAFGFDIADDAKIGYSVILSEHLFLGRGARIGSFTFVKGARLLFVGDYASLGNLNWVSAFPLGNSKHFSQIYSRDPCLIIGQHAAITNRHLIDCTDKVEIAKFSTFAGFRSQILTHSIDLKTNQQSCRPVKVGEYCFVGTSCVLLGGATLPNKSVLGAMSLLNTEFVEEGVLYGGVPAKKIMSLNGDAKYFKRAIGFVE